MTLDKSWFPFDANSDCWFLQQFSFFGDMALKRPLVSSLARHPQSRKDDEW